MRFLRTIRARFVIIYFILIFLTLIITGVFILKAFESHSLNDVKIKSDEIYDIIKLQLVNQKNNYSLDDAQIILNRSADVGIREEIYIIDPGRLAIVAASSQASSEIRIDQLVGGIIVDSLSGKVSERELILPSRIRVKDRAYPILEGEDVRAIIYIRYNLSDMYSMISSFRVTIVQGITVSLIISIFISFLLSKSITDPINELNKKTKLIAMGDFDQEIEVKTDDEIGDFSKTFQYLVTELKHRMTEISTEKLKLETIVNNLGEGLIATDSEGKILLCNPKAVQLLGSISAGELLELSGEQLPEIITEKYGRSLKMYFVPLLDELSSEVGMITVVQDITKEQQLESMRRDFVANVSHELKTPLTNIISYGETILDGSVDDQDTQNRFLNVMVDEAERMTRLVKDLLHLSRFDASSYELDRQWIDISELLEDTVLKLGLIAKQNNQTIEFANTEEFSAYVDLDRIEQVFINIISNAIKYSPENTKIKISIQADSEFLKISIKDQGPGIPEEDLSRIFERFYRIDKARSRNLGGTGLGLSIALEIIKIHSGHIEALSKPDEGTEMIISLPVN